MQKIQFIKLTNPQVCHYTLGEANHNTINFWHIQAPVNFLTTLILFTDQVLADDNLFSEVCV